MLLISKCKIKKKIRGRDLWPENYPVTDLSPLTETEILGLEFIKK